MSMQIPEVVARRGQFAAALGSTLFAAVAAAHEPPPPQLPFDDLAWAAKVGTQPAANLTMGGLHVSFERTALGDVAAAAGGAIAHRGDAGNTLRWLCYSLDGRATRQRLWLQSSGEMGGREQLVTAITATAVRRGRSRGGDRRCPPIAVIYLPVSFDNGIWLGMRVASLVAKFGAPPGTLGSWSGYRYQRKGDGTCKPGGFDVLNSLQWRSAGGVVEMLNAGQVSSC